ncbi:hypothetical protein TNCV_2672201 [Trichonephila clavipes]|nr:hypothetical protein TNCV_2672201 [Trichonephila clavipes]
METPFWVAHSTACLRPVRKAFLLIRVSIPGQRHRAKLWDSPLRFLKRSALLFSELFSLLLLVLFFSPGLFSSPEKEPF